VNFNQQLKRIRRYLRDPEGNIWDDTYLKTSFNDIQRETQHASGVLESVETIDYPPKYQFSYLFDWEWEYLPTGQTHFHRCLRRNNDYAFCAKWETQSYVGQTADAEEEGIFFTHPWEGLLVTPGDVIPVKFPADFYKTRLLVYDYRPLESLRRDDVIRNDRSRLTRTGTPTGYYREDTFDDTFIPYPIPTGWSFDDVDDTSPDYVFAHDWEDTDYLSGDGERFTREDDTNTRTHVFTWEADLGAGTDYLRIMFPFEASIESTGLYGMVVYTSSESAFGVYAAGDYFNGDEGITVRVIDGENNLLIIHDALSADIQDNSDESDFPEFLQKYLECGTIARAYSANTDGKIGSMQEYWQMRYQIGQELIRRFMGKRRSDRRYTMSGGRPRQRPGHPRLPSTYPV
jgi:hypothetical protein